MSTKRKRQRISSDWRELPPTIIEKIYSYLDISDRLNMSLVCKSWSQEYGSPSLWKNFKFNITEKNLHLKVWPEVKFIKKFGHSFKEIEIEVTKGLTRKGFEKAGIQLQLFFEALLQSNSQLLSIKLDTFFISHRIWYRYDESPNLFQSVLNFMKAQKNLQIVEFFHCNFEEEDGVNLLKLICENNTNTLKALRLYTYIRKSYDFEICRNDMSLQYRTLMQSFMNLHVLETSYSHCFENSMNSISINQNQIKMTKKLSLIKIHCDGFDKMQYSMPFKGIETKSWQNLRKICPSVKVKFRIYYEYPIVNHFSFYLVNHIPLAHLEFRGPLEPIEGMVIGDLLRHICDCKANEHLEYLSIKWLPNVNNISADFIPFLQTCQELKTLKICLRFPVAGIKELFRYMFECRPVSLESIYLSLDNVMVEADRSLLMLLGEEYSSLLLTRGLKLTLKTFILDSTEDLS